MFEIFLWTLSQLWHSIKAFHNLYRNFIFQSWEKSLSLKVFYKTCCQVSNKPVVTNFWLNICHELYNSKFAWNMSANFFWIFSVTKSHYKVYGKSLWKLCLKNWSFWAKLYGTFQLHKFYNKFKLKFWDIFCTSSNQNFFMHFLIFALNFFWDTFVWMSRMIVFIELFFPAEDYLEFRSIFLDIFMSKLVTNLLQI